MTEQELSPQPTWSLMKCASFQKEWQKKYDRVLHESNNEVKKIIHCKMVFEELLHDIENKKRELELLLFKQMHQCQQETNQIFGWLNQNKVLEQKIKNQNPPEEIQQEAQQLLESIQEKSNYPKTFKNILPTMNILDNTKNNSMKIEINIKTEEEDR